MAHKRVSVLLVVVALAATAMLGVLATQAQAALRHIDGTVVSKNAGDRTFKLKTQSGNRLTIRVNGATVFDRIGGFGGLRSGMAIEVNAAQTTSGLLAKHVEPREGGGGSGGGGGADDGPGHH
ncbi:MAG TPA: hypothetical protein VFI17_07230 [Solirubrobacterales bacterium]|nr:hypothetical protein [Solirubrobacterales bacterium]